MRTGNLLTLLLVLAVGLLAACGPSAPRRSLHSAVQRGDVKIVEQHIAAGSDLNIKDASGWTPLQQAAMKGDLPIVEALVQGGANVGEPGPQGKTALDVARERGQTAVVEYLQANLTAQPESPSGGRRLIDGGLGVSDAMDAF